ncbi:MAG: hypothetical protein LBI17_00510 [Rickettsiales bacterium]|jgi:hypothetical protein|nr:hypothetical protein [Rickettsiales bacterium]
MTNPTYPQLRQFLSLQTLPVLRLIQLMRFKSNVEAGDELGFPHEESVRMAVEDFATPAEFFAIAELASGIAWLAGQDGNEVLDAMLALEFITNKR